MFVGETKRNLICLAKISYEGMVSGFPEQTVAIQGSLVFYVRKGSEASPHSGREG